MKEVMGPLALRSSNGVTEGFDSHFVRRTSGVVDHGESSSTVLIPPPNTTRVRCLPLQEDLGRCKINVCMELTGHKVK